jgi:protein phosphatase
MVTLRYAASSHVGLVRDHNEDSHAATNRLLAVADGVGGEAAGEVASAIAIEAIGPIGKGKAPSDPAAVLRRAADEANNNIGVSADENPERRGMATTLTALLFTDYRLDLVHAGDSRAYLLRGGELSQITRDDSYVQEMLEAGSLTREEISSHPYRSVVTKILQGYPMEPTCESRHAELGDPDAAAQTLINLALEAGGPDNVTVLVGDVVESNGLKDKMTNALSSVRPR